MVQLRRHVLCEEGGAGLNGPRSARTAWTVVALIVGASALRLFGHVGSGLWYDEIRSLVQYIRPGWHAVLASFPNNNNHPLYNVLAKCVVAVAGESAFSVRLPAILAGGLGVGVLYLYGRRVSGEGEALAAAALLATSYHGVWFSQNARGYTLLLLLTLASTWLFESLLERPTPSLVLGYAGVLGLAIYTQLSALFLAPAHFVAYLLALVRGGTLSPERRLWPLLGLLLAGALTTVLYAPIMPEMLSYFLFPPADSNASTSSTGWAISAAARSLGIGLVPGLVVLIGGGAVLAVGAIDIGRASPRRLVLYLMPGALVALPMVFGGRGLYPRFFFFLAGFFLLLAVRGVRVTVRAAAALLSSLGWSALSRRLEVAVYCVIGIVWLALLPRAFGLPKQDFEGTLRFLQRTRQPGEVVLTAGLSVLPFARYYPTDFVVVTTVDDLTQHVIASRGAYFLSTLARFDPPSADILAAVQRRGRVLATFPGSVADGEVVVYRLEPGSAPGG